MKVDEDSKLIICILPQGSGAGLVERLSREKAVHSANVSSGRGRGAGSVGSIGAWDEIDILAITVPAKRADEIFSFVFKAGKLNRPRGGIMYQHAVAPATEFILPDIEENQPT
jgi:S1-C subfamily serine protease